MNINKSILEDADKLKRHDRKFADLTKEAEAILARIAEAIAEAHANGKRKLHFTIPNLLQVPGFTNKESQVYIYTAIIRLLEEKNYQARIRIEQASSIMLITWGSREEVLEMGRLKEYLRQRSV